MMTTLHSLPCRPDVAAMDEMVRALFAHARTGKVELAWTSPRVPHGLNGARMFDVADLTALVEHAARMNMATNRNVYVSAGLRRPEVVDDRRAGVSDVFAVTALKADCDAPGCIETAIQICEALGMEPSYAMFTGHEPHRRGSLWWVLDAPSEDLARARRIEQALQAKFGSDPAVCEPSRVMRLAGSVAWPLKQGRVLEMTGPLDTPVRAAPYTLDEIEETLRAAGAMPMPAPTATVLDFSKAPRSFDYDALVERAATEWHVSARELVSNLWSRGTPGDVIIDMLCGPLTQPGYTTAQTRVDLVTLVRGCAAKWEQPPLEKANEGWAPIADAETEEKRSEPAPPARNPFPLLAIEDLGAGPPPSWRIPGVIPETGFGVLYGASGTFKSFIALDLLLSVAHGIPWRGVPVDSAPVVYIAGEGTHGIGKRVVVWREHRATGAQCSGFWLAPVAANLLDRPMVALIVERLLDLPVKPRLIAVDTLARSFGSGNENDAKDMNAFVAACDYIASRLDAFVLAVHHAGKDTERGARGSSVLRAAADVEISVKRGLGEMSAIVRVTKQKDAEEGRPLSVRMVPAEAVHKATGEVIASLVPVTEEASEDADAPPRDPGRLGKIERAVLAVLDDGPATWATLKARIGVDKGSLNRAIRALRTKNFIAQRDDSYELIGGAENDEE